MDPKIYSKFLLNENIRKIIFFRNTNHQELNELIILAYLFNKNGKTFILRRSQKFQEICWFDRLEFWLNLKFVRIGMSCCVNLVPPSVIFFFTKIIQYWARILVKFKPGFILESLWPSQSIWTLFSHPMAAFCTIFLYRNQTLKMDLIINLSWARLLEYWNWQI